MPSNLGCWLVLVGAVLLVMVIFWWLLLIEVVSIFLFCLKSYTSLLTDSILSCGLKYHTNYAKFSVILCWWLFLEILSLGYFFLGVWRAAFILGKFTLRHFFLGVLCAKVRYDSFHFFRNLSFLAYFWVLWGCSVGVSLFLASLNLDCLN